MRAPSLVQDVTRATIEDFLYEEAALLDEWRLQEWLDLLTEDATYEVPGLRIRPRARAGSLAMYAFATEKETLSASPRILWSIACASSW